MTPSDTIWSFSDVHVCRSNVERITMPFIHRLIGFLLYMCVSVFYNCCVQASASPYFWSLGQAPSPPMPEWPMPAVYCIKGQILKQIQGIRVVFAVGTYYRPPCWLLGMKGKECTIGNEAEAKRKGEWEMSSVKIVMTVGLLVVDLCIPLCSYLPCCLT